MFSDEHKKTQSFQYAWKIYTNDIVACKKVKWSINRFLKDLLDTYSDDSPYYFDVKECEKIQFFASCMKFTSGGKAGQNVKLSLFQSFIAENLFAFKRKSDNVRRFRKSYILIARKNAKTFLITLLSLYSALTESRGELYSAATKRDQAQIAFKEATALINSSPQLRRRFKTQKQIITDLMSGSTFMPLSSDARTLDGTSPSFAIIDEFGAHQNYDVYSALASGMGARLSPLIVAITTAYDISSSAGFEEYKVLVDMIEERVELDDTYFFMLYELDEGDNPYELDNLIKANPLLNDSPTLPAFLEGEIKSAKTSAIKLKHYLIKNCNVWQEGTFDSYIDYSIYKGVVVPKFNIDDTNEQDLYIGVDLSRTTDLTSVSVVYKSDEKYYVFSHSFLPEGIIEAKEAQDKIPYRIYANQGYLTLTPGAVVDYSYVKNYILNLPKKTRGIIKEVDFDPYNALHLMQDLSDEGINCVEVRQGYRTLSTPTKLFREELYKGNVVIEFSPIFDFAIKSATTKTDSNDNEMLDKKSSQKSGRRIDPIAACLNAFSRCIRKEENQKEDFVYNTNEIFYI